MNYKINTHVGNFIYHWFFFVLGTLKDIDLSSKINVCFDIEDYISYQEETINILSDLINVVPNNYTDEWTFITHHREQGDPELCYFLRDIFLSRIKNDFNTSGYERIYIRRSKSHLCKGNADENFIRRRQIINEDQIVEKLSEIGIKSVYFEDYTVSEKIQIFQNASLVVAPQSGGLLFTLFGHQNMDIVEICPTNTHQPCNHYVDICNVLNIPFRRFDDVIKNDYHDNMIVDTEKLVNFILDK